MVDEITDVGNKEQLTFVIRWVDQHLDAHEEFLGLYNLSSTTADSIVASIKDILLYLQRNYEVSAMMAVASTVAGARGGVATRMQEIEPRAVFMHCYGHALNLSVKDTIMGSASLKDCLDTCFELIKLIKFSPKREAMLTRIKEETGSESNSIRTMCPTRWMDSQG